MSGQRELRCSPRYATICNRVLGSDAFDRLSSRLEVRANPGVDYLLAVGARGSVSYAGAGDISAAIRAETAAWLGERPRPEIA